MAAGRTGATWRKVCVQVYARREPCIRCGQRIDYTLPYLDPDTGERNPQSKSVDHYPHPLSKRPDLAESLNNLRAAHLLCNQSASDTATPRPTGLTSRNW